MTEHQFHQFVLISADDVTSLRACDVWRVIDAAAEHKMVAPFAAWLVGKRPELSAAIDQAVAEAAA